jgi:exodeoxyribonuclease VII large subunit
MRIYPVSEITRYLKDLLEADGALADIWISGEVSNLSESAAGHLYFTIKDEASQLRCVLFNRGRLPVTIQNGMAVVSHGRISIYEASGALQLYVDVIQPEGVGILHLEFERLRARLEQEGLFEPARKRALPPFPRRIAVVTSPDGAALRDIINIISRRYPLAELLLCPTPVQGDGAVPGIVRAFDTLNRAGDIDAVILARGGGSLEDLWAFNEEAVARAIYASKVPVISGVGHETDFTIADYVADVRAPTPSAAAELAVPHQQEIETTIASNVRAMTMAISSLMERFQQRVDELGGAVATCLENLLATNGERLRAIGLQLDTLNPLATLRRGYALVQRSEDAEVIRSIEQVDQGDLIQVRVSDGQFNGRVSGAKKGSVHE